MFTKTHCLSIALLFFLASCKTDYSEGYSIKDFRKELRPYLTKIVSKANVRIYEEELHNLITDEEVLQLSKSEHQVLRAWAFPAMKGRTSLDYQKELMIHLDDTAVIIVDYGEFGTKQKTVSDFILEEAKWKDWTEKNKVIDKVVFEHNYLKSAYTILSYIEPREKYYPYIRDMCIRRRKYDAEYGEQGFEDIEYALSALAKFKKKEDVALIRGLLLPNVYSMTSLSFKLMKDYPDTAYLDVFERYFSDHYYSSYPRDKIYELAPLFTSSIAVYKNARSAKILNSILNGRKGCWVPINNGGIRSNLLYEIWNNPCEAYTKLRNQIADEVQSNGIEKKDHSAYFWTPTLLDSSATNTAWFQ